MDNNKLTTTSYFSPAVWGQMKEMATTFIESKALPKNIENAAQAIMIMQAGYEMGMKPLEAVKSLYIVNGQINIWGAALVRRIREHGWTIEYKMGVERGGNVTAIIRKGKERYEQTAYFDSAEKSGYTKDYSGKAKIGWREGTNRELKLKYLAISMLIKTKVAEVLGSINDIQEVAEDYPVEEIVSDTPKKKEDNLITSTPEERKGALTDFINKNKDKKRTKKDKVKAEEGEVVRTSTEEEVKAEPVEEVKTNE